jgi:hypothetical protein
LIKMRADANPSSLNCWITAGFTKPLNKRNEYKRQRMPFQEKNTGSYFWTISVRK